MATEKFDGAEAEEPQVLSRLVEITPTETLGCR